MDRDPAVTERMRNLITQLISLTEAGTLHWERQVDSAHRYARWKNNLLILGPAQALTEDIPRYLFVTPFDSPACVEVNSNDSELGKDVMRLVETVEVASAGEQPSDPFAITDEVLGRFN